MALFMNPAPTKPNPTLLQAAGTPDAHPRRVRRIALALAVVAVLAVTITAIALYGRRMTIALTQDQIQSSLDGVFPIQKHLITLAKPRVALPEGANRITVGADAAVNISINNRTLSGRATISAGLRYEAAEGAFYLDDPLLDQLDVRGIPVQHVGPVNTIARAVARERIRHIHVYTLRPTDLKHAACSASAC